jgi:hypothetical protein
MGKSRRIISNFWVSEFTLKTGWEYKQGGNSI